MAETASENTSTIAPPPAPKLNPAFTSYLDVDTGALRLIEVGTGNRVNVGIKGGHWKLPSGAVFANIVPGVGGEFGIVDKKGVFHPAVTFTVQFDDGKFGYVTGTGHGVAAGANILSLHVETDSEKYSYLAGKVLLVSGVFDGSLLISSVFLPEEHWTK